MVDQEGMEPVEEQEKGGKSKIKLIIIGVAVIAVIGAAVGALFAFGILGSGGQSDADPALEPEQIVGSADPTKVLPTVPLESFVVNLSDAEQSRFLKVTIVIELTREDLAEEVEKRTQKIKDAVITLLSSKSVAQVRDSKGKLKLKQEITLRLNEILGGNSVSEILFTEFIIS
ncbi:MAG: flagellar basal body-associated FliL family protein [Candidatus Lernaella stagnicola]|nr:flagellar basal body-associated FliL family protein [Candidatus Lernaella stagnicola]